MRPKINVRRAVKAVRALGGAMLPIEPGVSDFAALPRKERYSFTSIHPRKLRGEDAEIILCGSFEIVPVRLLRSTGIKRGLWWVERHRESPRAWPWRRLERSDW